MSTKLYIVRHGQSVKNVQKVTQGHSHDHENNLSDLGRKQAEELSCYFADLHFDACYSSPYLRTTETAKILVKNRATIEVIIDDRLKEKHQGESIGQSVKDTLLAYQDWNEISEDDRLDKRQFEGEETQRELRQRVLDVTGDLFEKYINKNVLVVTHGGVLRSLLTHYMKKTYKELWKFENCGHMVLEKSAQIVSVSSTAGLSLISREDLF